MWSSIVPKFDEHDLPIAFASKTFTKGEKNKTVILKELTAIHWAINYFKAYLYGRKFIVKTDHRPLVFLFGMKDPTSKLTKMRLDFGEYDFSIEYVEGRANVGADALSRIVTTSDELKQLSVLMVNTRSMTHKQKQYSTPVTNEVISVTDQSAMYNSENQSET